jgi:hypothetical protein
MLAEKKDVDGGRNQITVVYTVNSSEKMGTVIKALLKIR